MTDTADTSTGPAAECHVVTHVHWDREWYRPFEAFRARLVELAEQVCAELAVPVHVGDDMALGCGSMPPPAG
jgi:hypothetical protein